MIQITYIQLFAGLYCIFCVCVFAGLWFADRIAAWMLERKKKKIIASLNNKQPKKRRILWTKN